MSQLPTQSAPMKNITPLQRNGIQSLPSSPAPALRATLPGRRSALPLVLLFAALLAQPCAATPFQWDYTGNLNVDRFGHRATLLTDGRVLVAGGAGAVGGDQLASSELYDPATGTWSFTGSLNTARAAHTVTLLPDGRVLVAGGFGSTGLLTSAELYDPATGTWSVTGSLNTARDIHTATLLPSGKVLVVGGSVSGIGLASAELYDPATGIWSVTGSLNTGRYNHTATLVGNGKVLVAGGNSYLATTELYNPATGTWTFTGSLSKGRIAPTATLLTNGKVLVAGGFGSSGDTAGAELYDSATGIWTVTGSLNTGRYNYTATLLADGKVLAAGGRTDGLASTELYDPATGTWTFTGSLNRGRLSHTATMLTNGEVLVAGGQASPGGVFNTAELYDPGIVAPTTVTGRGALDNQGNQVTFNFRATLANDSSILGRLSFCDPAAGVCLTKAGVRSLSINGNSADFSGSARLDDGTRVTFSVTVTDNGLPGTSDTISISLGNGYSASGNLTSGDIQIY